MKRKHWIFIIVMGVFLCLLATKAFGEQAEASQAEASVVEKPAVVEIPVPQIASVVPIQTEAKRDNLIVEGMDPQADPEEGYADFPYLVENAALASEEPVKYTLVPEDVITIDVRRHPEFSGVYVINSEGKIQYKYVGDISITGLTKTEAKEKLTKILSVYLVEPAVDVTITEYRSKVFYVIGEVGRPGKYYMWADEIPIREAVVQAGLPLLSASSSKSKLITPDDNGKPKSVKINLDKILYKGDLRQNIMMKPGDVLYVPATLVTKFMRKIAPVAQPVQATVSAESSFYRLGTGDRYRDRR